MFRTVSTATLEIGYEVNGPDDGPPVVLLHGWPSDPHDWDGVVPELVAEGCRVLAPWLRGYGPTRFLQRGTPRSGQQAALGADLRDFLDALAIEDAFLAGYDWGGRAACVAAAMWPERVRGLVSIGGYNIQNISASGYSAAAAQEHRLWYVWYFQTERGRAGLEANRRDIARLLWRLWSPNWQFDDATFEVTAASFDNPDFVAVTIHSYRHRHRNAPGDPVLEPIEQRLAAQPAISVPTIVLHGAADGVSPVEQSAGHAAHFTGRYDRRVVPVAGHFLSRETPDAVVQALRDLIEGPR
ncbi:MAG: alpha/beta hydrolase [Alphaproteobacteria bacterium]|nr:alpha/beta hydrolase [Alphaproteobacteria bacterium]